MIQGQRWSPAPAPESEDLPKPGPRTRSGSRAFAIKVFGPPTEPVLSPQPCLSACPREGSITNGFSAWRPDMKRIFLFPTLLFPLFAMAVDHRMTLDELVVQGSALE